MGRLDIRREGKFDMRGRVLSFCLGIMGVISRTLSPKHCRVWFRVCGDPRVHTENAAQGLKPEPYESLSLSFELKNVNPHTLPKSLNPKL